MFAEGGVDPRMTFDTFESLKGKTRALTKCVDWCTHFGQPLASKPPVLFGPTGVGKTHLGNAVAHFMVTQRGLFSQVLPTVCIPRRDTDEVLRLADPDEVPVLVLDDLGAEKRTDRALECLYILIDGRLRARAPTVVTTNFEPDALEQWLGDEYGPRIVGRLREMGEFVPVGGEDMRLRM